LNAGAGIALLRLVRRVADIVVVFLALLATLRLFAIDPTPALAGLGVGGIAIALAAQKTLENVIAGVSLIADRACVSATPRRWATSSAPSTTSAAVARIGRSTGPSSAPTAESPT
jgi:hypothetical protein